MDYSPQSKREIWPFLKVAISLKPETSRQPKLVCMHVTSIPTCIEFLSRFQMIKGNLAVFESSIIFETGDVMLTKIGVHECDINPYLHKYFKPIPND